jgi:DNA-directed RNA polymerase subunit N (RpoN/RPB10)
MRFSPSSDPTDYKKRSNWEISLQSFQTKLDPRRQVFLSLSGQIEGQLRAAYDQRFHAGEVTQTKLANRLGVNRSCVNRRLLGHTNMTVETIADMVWALGFAIKVDIYDPTTVRTSNHFIESSHAPALIPAKSTAPRSAGLSSAPLAIDLLNKKQAPIPVGA